jgi:hypothetical protein
VGRPSELDRPLTERNQRSQDQQHYRHRPNPPSVPCHELVHTGNTTCLPPTVTDATSRLNGSVSG